MSTGPVGFSDAIGATNASLIKKTCNENGTLLKPSKPLTTIDRLILVDNTDENHDAPTVLASYDGASASAPVRAWYVVSFGSWNHGNHQPDPAFTLFSSDLWPPLPMTLNHTGYSGRLARWRWGGAGLAPHCGNGMAVEGCATLIEAGGSSLLSLTSAPTAKAEPLAPALHVFAPECGKCTNPHRSLISGDVSERLAVVCD